MQHLQQPIVLRSLLLDHGVAGLRVHRRKAVLIREEVKCLGGLLDELDGQLVHDVLRRFAASPTAAPARAGAQCHDVLQQRETLGLGASNLAIFMQAEDLWRCHDRQASQVVEEVILGCATRAIEEAAGGKLVIRPLDDDILANEDFDHAFDEDLVFLVCHTAAVVDLGSQELQHLVRDLIVRVQEVLELPSVCDQVLWGEVVWDVPADGTELPSVLANGMEEAEAVNEPCVGLRLLAVRQHAVVALHHRTEDVGAQTFGRLICHLHAILEQKRRELLGGHGRQPQTVRIVCLFRIHLLAYPFELREPRDGQVTIAKKDPTTGFSGTFDHSSSLRPLALTE
mmetsp:Transcript_2819/g.6858  ORF Transcript_2819/g.6858 Transcript_2819/m.6858 type:complete len:341 (-) Transcript_2819:7009-8031(-)